MCPPAWQSCRPQLPGSSEFTLYASVSLLYVYTLPGTVIPQQLTAPLIGKSLYTNIVIMGVSLFRFPGHTLVLLDQNLQFSKTLSPPPQVIHVTLKLEKHQGGQVGAVKKSSEGSLDFCTESQPTNQLTSRYLHFYGTSPMFTLITGMHDYQRENQRRKKVQFWL